MNNEDDWAKFAELANAAAEEIDRLRKEREIVTRELRNLSYVRWPDDWLSKLKENPAPRKPAVPLERYVVRRLELSRRGWRR